MRRDGATARQIREHIALGSQVQRRQSTCQRPGRVGRASVFREYRGLETHPSANQPVGSLSDGTISRKGHPFAVPPLRRPGYLVRGAGFISRIQMFRNFTGLPWNWR